MTKEQQPVALSVKNVSKNFHLPHEKANSIKSSIVNIFKPKDKEVDVQHALKDISFDVKEGEFFGILGRNGSGKSTMLKILAEIYKPTTGSVKTHGKLVPFIELGVGFNPELTGRENVYLNGALLGFSRKEIDARYDDIVEFAELEEFMDQKLKNYSSGMQVRLAFSVATRAEADILLVDEVLAVGDADFQRKCYDFFMSLKKQKKTVVFVTHDMGAVREYCDRAILINEGEISHSGVADKVANEYLKLFNKPEPSEVDEDSKESLDDRWGNGLIKAVSVDTHVTNEKVVISLITKSTNKPVENAVVGFNIQTDEDKLVTGSKITKLNYRPNETKTVEFELPYIFGNGKYSVNTWLLLGDQVTVCDNWTHATYLTINRDDSHYPVEIEAKINVH